MDKEYFHKIAKTNKHVNSDGSEWIFVGQRPSDKGLVNFRGEYLSRAKDAICVEFKNHQCVGDTCFVYWIEKSEWEKLFGKLGTEKPMIKKQLATLKKQREQLEEKIKELELEEKLPEKMELFKYTSDSLDNKIGYPLNCNIKWRVLTDESGQQFLVPSIFRGR